MTTGVFEGPHYNGIDFGGVFFGERVGVLNDH